MAASRPYARVAHSLASRLCAASPRVCASAVPTPPLLQGHGRFTLLPRIVRGIACGYCSQQLAHSTSSTSNINHPCPGATHTPSPSPLATPTHALPHAPTTSPPRRINRRTELDFDELRALQLAGDIALIDVRDTQELENYGGIPGSLNIPLGKIKQALQLSEDEFYHLYNIEKPDLHDRNLVFYARGPNASSAAVEIAHRLGFKRSRHYTGGWEDYCRQTGLPLKKNQEGNPSRYYMNNFDQFFL